MLKPKNVFTPTPQPVSTPLLPPPSPPVDPPKVNPHPSAPLTKVVVGVVLPFARLPPTMLTILALTVAAPLTPVLDVPIHLLHAHTAGPLTCLNYAPLAPVVPFVIIYQSLPKHPSHVPPPVFLINRPSNSPRPLPPRLIYTVSSGHTSSANAPPLLHTTLTLFLTPLPLPSLAPL